VRRLLVAVAILSFACGLEASVQTPQTLKSLSTQPPAADQKLKDSALELMRAAKKDQLPVTARPADGKSFANEFVSSEFMSQEKSATQSG
jgi:hypothetical protein